MSTDQPSDELFPAGDSAEEDRPAGQYVVVARRYRPQTFEELVGQEQVSQGLRNAIATNRVGHAYLFAGARGVGKTSAARILAKALNCTTGPTPTPCNQCDTCEGVASGEDIDVVEIDGASNRRIEEIRQLRSNVNIRPSRSRFKIYIIDEVHMLTREAFNALLKTLEEPPEHVKFIFCTTDPEKIPITVLSRCQRFDFLGIQPESIIKRLQQIAEAEGADVESEALAILARRAAGSMRDSQSLLEQLLAFGGDRVTVDSVHAMLGTARGGQLSELIAALLERDAAKSLAALDAAFGEGVDSGQLVEQLLGHFRDMMAATVGCPADMMLQAAPQEHDDLQKAGGQLGLTTILAVIQILDQTILRMRLSTHSRTLAEMALVRICNVEDLQQLPALIAQLKQGGLTSLPPSPARASTGRAAATARKAAPASSSNPSQAASTASMPAGSAPPMPASAPAPDAPAADRPVEPLTAETASKLWDRVLSNLGDMTADQASRYDRAAISAPNRLVIFFSAKYTACKSYCERPEKRDQLEKALSSAAGTRVHLEFRLLQDETSGPAEQRPSTSPRQRAQEMTSRPMVRQAMELFDAQVVRVEEPRKPPSDELG